MKWPAECRPNPASISRKPIPDVRPGCPDPLIYYLHAAALAHHQVIAAAGPEGGTHLDGHLTAEARAHLRDLCPWDMVEASCARLKAALSGIDKWQAAPVRRPAPTPPVLWQSGPVRLLDYGLDTDKPPVLVIPSLINKPYILDLMEDASFLRRMAASGARPVLLDWGNATAPGAPQSITACLEDVLLPAFEHLASLSSGRPGLLGYCMGGTLGAGLAAHLGDRVARLALIGAPWDFSKLGGAAKAYRAHAAELGPERLRQGLRGAGHAFGAVPANLFQHLFAAISPMQVVQKFSAFDALDPTSAKARKFVAVEDWLADATAVAAGCAETILIDWYVENQCATGHWRAFDAPVDPARITCPTLIITGQRDHIVPTAVATSLVPLIPNCQHVQLNMGHVGMIVGTSAHALVADRISAFF